MTVTQATLLSRFPLDVFASCVLNQSCEQRKALFTDPKSFLEFQIIF